MKIKIIAIIIALVVVIGASYWFGKKNSNNQDSTPSPTSSETPSVSNSPTPTPTSTPTSSRSPSPTPTRTPTPTPTPRTTTLNSSGLLDGFESSNGGGNTSLEIRAGRNANLITRGFVSFDIPASLAGKTIEKATLRLYQSQIVGDPYSVGGSAKVDHLDYGSSLENADYSTSSLSSSFGTLTSNENIEWKDLEVTDRLRDDLANARQRSQYRIHMANESTGGGIIGDFAYFESQDNNMHTGNYPQLVVIYR